MKPPKRYPEKMQAQCDAFNAAWPVGKRVSVLRDDDTVTETVTTSAAHVLGGHTSVIWLEGISGCFALDRVGLPISNRLPKNDVVPK